MGLPGDRGFVGCATVARSAILAYFHDPETVTLDGRSYNFEGYHVHECIVDPVAVRRVVIESITTPDSDANRQVSHD